MSDAMLTVLQPPGWKRPRGYSNGLVGTGRFVMIAGQIGWDAEERLADGLVAQTRQALANVLVVLAEAGGAPHQIARMTWYLTDVPDYRARAGELGPVWRDLMGRNFPAMAAVGVTALVEPGALIEIEATAILPAGT